MLRVVELVRELREVEESRDGVSLSLYGLWGRELYGE